MFFDPILPHHETGTRFRPWEFIHAVKMGEKDSSDKLCILLFVPKTHQILKTIGWNALAETIIPNNVQYSQKVGMLCKTPVWS